MIHHFRNVLAIKEQGIEYTTTHYILNEIPVSMLHNRSEQPLEPHHLRKIGNIIRTIIP